MVLYMYKNIPVQVIQFHHNTWKLVCKVRNFCQFYFNVNYMYMIPIKIEIIEVTLYK